MEDIFTNPSIDPNKALSFSAPLYLYYTNPTPLCDSTNTEFNDFKFESYQNTVTAFDSTGLSFADELFDSGVLLPLKPPPRLQNTNYRSKSRPSSPTMRTILKKPFARLSPSKSKHKDFDPFMVAVEKIRKDDFIEQDKEISRCSRSRSLSPMRNWNWVKKREENLIEPSPINEGMTSEMTRKIMLNEKKRFVLKQMRKPVLSYKQGFLMCFGFSF
ncbi:hypothetical protein LUZ60_003979 [Juncus effusus]|nr:hypothetical protein LUZ60_003979 [Juncus effusus]